MGRRGQRHGGHAPDESELLGVLDLVPAAVLIKDRDSRVLYMNPAGAVGYGQPREALIGKRERDFMPPGNDVDGYLRSDVEVIDSGVPQVLPDYPFVASDGGHHLLHIDKSPVSFGGCPAVMIHCYALQSRHSVIELERKVAEKQRLESLGVLAGGIAHDFNNLLVGVLTHADLALRTLGPHSRAGGYIGRVRDAALQLTELSRQMLAYTGRAKASIEPVDLSALSREMLQLTATSLPRNLRLHTEFDGSLPPVGADAAQLGQVVLNLVTNAAEALDARPGEVTIRTEACQFDPRVIGGELSLGADLPAGRYVCLTVDDDGCGMEVGTLQRMFDPFFTTKRSGRGLGLSAVLGIVRAHRGALHVQTAPGRGSRIRVWLPELARVTARTRRITPRARPRQLAGSVLLVDDEPVVLQATGAMLEDSGFRVCTASRAAEAIEVLTQRSDVALAVLDVTMPGMTVTEAHAGMRRVRPDLPILLTSGYSGQDEVDRLVDGVRTRFLEKPYLGEALIEVLGKLAAQAARTEAGLDATR